MNTQRVIVERRNNVCDTARAQRHDVNDVGPERLKCPPNLVEETSVGGQGDRKVLYGCHFQRNVSREGDFVVAFKEAGQGDGAFLPEHPQACSH